eukprot:symbB.v1.2.021554.t1/scaffold1847.1/size122519/7
MKDDSTSVLVSTVMLDGCNILGFIFAYTVAFGWVACVLGIVAAALTCCVCCQCCKAKLDEPNVQQKPPMVVGQPACFESTICGILGWHNGGSRMEKKHAMNMGHIMSNPSSAWS